MFSNYDKEPSTVISGFDNDAQRGYAKISTVLNNQIHRNRKTTLVIECYPSVRHEEIIEGLKRHLPISAIFHAEHACKSINEINTLLDRYLTDDRVLGFMTPFRIEEMYDSEKINEIQEKFNAVREGIVVIIGFGASLVAEGDILIYADLARWEIQQRYRTNEFGNWHADNEREDILKKYKRGYFHDWRMADRLKRSLFNKIDYYLDTNSGHDPKMVSWNAYVSGLKQLTSQPFRLVPYFDPGVWGGRWLEKHMNLPAKEYSYAWGFDGVPEENSLYLDYGSIRIESPAINLVYLHPKALLGERVYARFGAEFPIRFDFLDTLEGQPLSLQVHPTVGYIQEQFGMSYTQDESYYIIESKTDAAVYLGLTELASPEQMIEDLTLAQQRIGSFPVDHYINAFPARKHDHFLIPAGTIHCAASDCVVLEISATPYIFTFKLWDWDRCGLDGKPRPVHIAHGAQVIQWDRTTSWVEQNLVNKVERIDAGNGWIEERTGLHEFQFIETHRHWFSEKVEHTGNGSVQVLNLVEGESAIVESPDESFTPFVIHFAETFIMPASISSYTIRPFGFEEGKRLATIKAYVRA
ncbi:mannose-6-phosphate isomerase [Paenibacillus sp. CCS19]|uniref:class I mannose-6-phosphate isomerase n=1 Tax=Paenibacillus sp. CCS19 TaxID=3158387 RepID=UPI00255E9083|nr:class I mannose-6-phosphate isomerase [Paenibacillus cellulosilyticus]GMK37291.1 mannose-6-phosphate isomerase [Paenibacillus cellulosilyticus]